MQSTIRIVRNRDEIKFISENGGRSFAWLLAIEIVATGILIFQLASVLQEPEVLALPIVAAIALMAWTVSHIRADYRITVNQRERWAKIVRISPLTGMRTESTFPVGSVESLALMQTVSPASHSKGWSEYVVALQLHGGERHIVSARGPLLAYHTSVERFAADAGLDTRIVRMATA